MKKNKLCHSLLHADNHSLSSYMFESFSTLAYFQSLSQKVQNTGFFRLRIWENTDQIKLSSWTFFTQSMWLILTLHSLTCILPCKDRIVDFVLIREKTGQWKPIFSHIFRRVEEYMTAPVLPVYYKSTGGIHTWWMLHTPFFPAWVSPSNLDTFWINYNFLFFLKCNKFLDAPKHFINTI